MYVARCSSPREYRRALAQLKAQKIGHIIVHTRPDHMTHLNRAILQLQMNNENYHYIFTSFDMELFDLEDFFYNRVNMSGWRIIERESNKVKETLQVMEKFHPIGASILSGGHIKTEPALIYDAVQVLALALANTKDISPTNTSCDTETPWSQGSALLENINKVQTQGLSGPIEFTSGLRTNFNLQLMRLKGGEDGGSILSGHWTPNDGLIITDPAAYKRNPPPNVTLTVVTVEEKPYVMVKEGWNLQGNARFEGFCIDLLARVAARAGFQYRLRLVPDNMYGARDPVTGRWNGIVRELLDKTRGVFVTLLCGLVLAIVVAILEFCWNTKKNASQGRQSLCSEMGTELRTAMRGGSATRTALRGGCSRCSSHTHVPTAVPANSRFEIQDATNSVELRDLRWS
ncbi:glutamate receptor ionotropic, kainate 2-like [Hyposmocoma kahamanoa]|uniref:glutamate receptor ionotropic, kainate 2-like n=1 Tax=Hyposmocoma kahamanoa TaxID=1477025 RepID=UPI000E6D95CC|nr:glutamate receptor ionotropic, kainate 2-like [Hyposmocoma kahamanoa]